MSGKLQAKLDDDVIDIEGPCAVRVAPEVVRSFWNDEAEDAHIVIVSKKIEDPQADGETVADFWPE